MSNKIRRITSIETFYNGHLFRSRMEARWAVFFDFLKVPYVYEREGFDLGSAGWYLPDFWLPEQDVWLEIKPDAPTKEEIKKALGLAERTGKLVLVFYDCKPATCLGFDRFINYGRYYAPDGTWDGLIEFNICSKCDMICVGHLGGHYFCCNENFDYKGNCEGLVGPKSERLAAAHAASQSARFKHIRKN